MEDNSRIALIGIIVEDLAVTTKVNELLHSCSDYIVGRFGIPYQKKKVNIISVVIDANQDVISALTGKIGAIKGVSVKTMFASK